MQSKYPESYMKGLYWVIFTAILGLCFQEGMAQQKPVVYEYNISMTDGLLANNYLICIEDRRGLIWMSSDLGLDVYNGTSIKNYSNTEYPFPYTYISHLSEDLNGNIWICSRPYNGAKQFAISVLNPMTDEFLPLEEYLPNYSKEFCDAIYDFNLVRGRFFIQTEDYKIYESKGEEFEYKTTYTTTSFFRPSILGVLGEQLVLLALDEQFYPNIIMVDLERKQPDWHYKTDKDKAIQQVLVLDSLGTFYWVEGRSSKEDSLELFFYKKEQGKPEVLIRSQMTDLSGTSPKAHLVYAKNYTFSSSDNRNLAYYTSEGKLLEKISLNYVNALDWANYLLTDRQGALWYRNRLNGGVDYANYTPSKFTAVQLFDEWVGIRGMIRKDSTLLIAPIHALLTEDIPPASKIGFKIKSINNAAGVLYDNGKGKIYAALEGHLVLALNEKGEEIDRYYFDNLDFKVVNIMAFEDETGKLWVGNNQGLFFLDEADKKLKPYRQQLGDFEELRNSHVYYFYPRGAYIWLATSSGLYQFHPQKGIQKRYHTGGEKHYLPHNHIAHIYEDKDEIFWLASKGGGVIKFNPTTGESEQFNRRSGLVNSVIYSVYEDDYNCLWMSSNYGIMRMNKNTSEINSYTKEHGLLDHEFNTSSHYKDSLGNIYFGSQLGVVQFHPRDFQQEETPSTAHVFIAEAQKIAIDTEEPSNILKDIVEGYTIDLSANDKGFELRAVLSDYRNPSLHQYAYKIEGFDKQWSYQDNPVVKHNNLPYGSYQLNIKIRDLNGYWIEMKQPITIIVRRPFYAQWWFYLLLFGGLVFSFASLLKWRTQQLLNKQQELEEIVEKRTQKIVQQAEDLKALDKVKSRFFANITHELRTPLTLILGPASALLNKLRGNQILDNKQAEKHLHHIINNGEQLLGLIEEILDLSKLEAHKLDLEEDKVHLKTFVSLLFDAFEEQAAYRNIRYELQFNATEELYLLMDSNKVEKMLNNLLSNAMKFTPSGKGIMLTVNDKGANVEFVVRDSGEGIHPDDLPHVFERFYQSKQGDKPAQGGTGIGLALVAEFANMMNGSIAVESELGNGAMFTLLLPKQSISVTQEEHLTNLKTIQEQVEYDEAETNWEPVPKDNTILLVEDHAEMRFFIASLLDQQYNIIVASNGKEGLEQIQQNASEIDLIISDVMMPEMDGFTMLSKIKAIPEWRSIPMILLTARAAEQDKLHALTIGVDDYLTKPFSVEELLARVSNLIQNAQARKAWLTTANKEVTPSPAKEVVEVSPKPIEETKELVVEPVEEAIVEESDLEWLKELEVYIKGRISDENLNVTELSKAMFIGERTFRRKIKKITGLSPQNLIKEIKMKEARERLMNGKAVSVSDVALDVGFKSHSSFSRAFKQFYGVSPAEYLKRH